MVRWLYTPWANNARALINSSHKNKRRRHLFSVVLSVSTGGSRDGPRSVVGSLYLVSGLDSNAFGFIVTNINSMFH